MVGWGRLLGAWCLLAPGGRPFCVCDGGEGSSVVHCKRCNGVTPLDWGD